MPRVFRPIRLFTEEDGKRKPTLFFFIFFFWIFALIAVLGYKYLSARSASRAAAAYLSRTPTPTATATPTSTASPAPSTTPTPSGTLTPTPFVYSDPATWELVEVPSEDGSTSLELQDWQKAEIYHFFEEYYNLAWRSETGMPELEKVLEYCIDDFYDYMRDEIYPELIKRGYYLEYPSLDQLNIFIRYLPEHSEVYGGFRVEVILVNHINWQTELRYLDSGEFHESRDYGPTENRNLLIFTDKQWKIYISNISRMNEE